MSVTILPIHRVSHVASQGCDPGFCIGKHVGFAAAAVWGRKVFVLFHIRKLIIEDFHVLESGFAEVYSHPFFG